MRWLIFILLVLNLGLFAWGYLQPEPREQAAESLEKGLPTIRLLSEEFRAQPQAAAPSELKPNLQADASMMEEERTAPLPEAYPSTESAVVSEPSDVEQEQQPTRCLRLGPFEQQVAATAAEAQLTATGHQTRQQVTVERSQSGYWVLIPPGDEDPDFVIVNLELAGIQDLWRFDKGELAGAISLGLYSDSKQAMERQSELEARGFQAEIRPRQVEKPGYWIETRYADGDEAAAAALEGLYAEHSWLAYPPPECEEVATP